MKSILTLLVLSALCVPGLANADHETKIEAMMEEEKPSSETYYRTQVQRQNTRSRFLNYHRTAPRKQNWRNHTYDLDRCWVRIGDTVQHVTGVDNESLCRTNHHETLENKINWVGKYDPALFEETYLGREAYREPYKVRLRRGFQNGRNTYLSHESRIRAKEVQERTQNPDGMHADRRGFNKYYDAVSGMEKLMRYRGLRK